MVIIMGSAGNVQHVIQVLCQLGNWATSPNNQLDHGHRRGEGYRDKKSVYFATRMLRRLTYISAKLEERDNLIREAWVKSMEIRLVRDELSKCHLAEGVNHYENCKWLAEKYLGMLRTTKVSYMVVICNLWH
jgi:hypothetical protein